MNSLGSPLSAVASARLKQGALTEPLLPKLESTTDASSYCSGDPEDNDDEEESSGGGLVLMGVALLLMAGGMATSAAAMVSVQQIIVYVSGGICIANSADVMRKQYQITRGKGLRGSINMMRKEMEKLQTQTAILSKSVDDLSDEVSSMKHFETELQSIASEQQTNVTEIVSLMKENEELLEKKKENLRRNFALEISKLLLRSGVMNSDMKIDLKDVPFIMLRLSIQLKVHGIVLDKEKFEAVIRENNDMQHVLKFVSGLLFKEYDEDDEEADKMNILSVDETASKGAVDNARGNRMNLMQTKKSSRSLVVKKNIEKELKNDPNKTLKRSHMSVPKDDDGAVADTEEDTSNIPKKKKKGVSKAFSSLKKSIRRNVSSEMLAELGEIPDTEEPKVKKPARRPSLGGLKSSLISTSNDSIQSDYSEHDEEQSMDISQHSQLRKSKVGGIPGNTMMNVMRAKNKMRKGSGSGFDERSVGSAESQPPTPRYRPVRKSDVPRPKKTTGGDDKKLRKYQSAQYSSGSGVDDRKMRKFQSAQYSSGSSVGSDPQVKVQFGRDRKKRASMPDLSDTRARPEVPSARARRRASDEARTVTRGGSEPPSPEAYERRMRSKDDAHRSSSVGASRPSSSRPSRYESVPPDIQRERKFSF